MKKQDTPRRAIALHYDEKNAPHISAKGEARLADEIIALAREHGIPLHQDEQLAALLSQLNLGSEIPRELYLAVAEVLAFAYMLTGRVPANWRERQEGSTP